tara:strand:- start:141 stop:587 length:447 start_codon:yes stop_codon:yes gene_type:complete
MFEPRLKHNTRKIICIIFFIFYLIISGCGGNTGIINGGFYKNEQGDFLSSYYIYDFVSEEKISNHVLESFHVFGQLTINYYFSHNSNIPSNSIKHAKSIENAKSIIISHSYNIKYIGIKDRMANTSIIDCLVNPDNEFCNGKLPIFSN